MSEWRSIESAPRDGKIIIAFAKDIHGVNDAGGAKSMIRTTYHMGVGGIAVPWAGFTTHYPPTHWLPLDILPPPPSDRETEE